MITPKNRARDGLHTVKESIFDLLTQHPEGLTNVEIAKMLGLESNRGGHRNFLTWTILGEMMDEGRVRFEKAGELKKIRHRYFAVKNSV